MSGPDPLIHDVQQTAEYRELNRQTQKDMKNLGKKLEPLAVNLINTELSFDTRIQIFGETISSTLMARNHRGGYTTNSSGLYSLKVDFMNDFGINLDDSARLLGFETVMNLLMSDHMKPYVEINMNADNDKSFFGRVFENKLLEELLNEQKIGHDADEKRAKKKLIEAKARMELAKINPVAIQGRLKIYRIVSKLARGQQEFVSYQDVQTEYARTHGVQLNETELKKYFGTGKALTALKEYTSGDDLKIILSNNCAIFIGLKRSLADIEKSYAGRLEEAEKLPDEETIIKTNSELHEKRRTSRKPTIAAPPTFVSEDDKSTEVSVADSIPSLSVNESVQTETLSKKPRKGESSRHFEEYTNVGDDEFSDSSDDEKEHMPKRVKPLPAPGIFSPVKPLNKANHVSRAEEATVGNQNKITSSTVPAENVMVSQSESPGGELEKERMAKAFVFGYLKMGQPLWIQVSQLSCLAAKYMNSEYLSMKKRDIEKIIREMDNRLKFSADGTLVSLKGLSRRN